LIRLDQVNESAVVVSLDGVVRQEDDASVRVDQELDVYELVREEYGIIVIECGS
jgi:hypothetical protein